MLVVYFVNYFIALQGDEAWNVAYGWRWMFGSEALPAAALLVLLFFVPPTPRWLTKQGRREEALHILERIAGPVHAQTEMAEIEQALAEEGGTLAQLFRPGMRIVLVIGIALAVLQQVTGINVFLYYAPEIFKSLGTAADSALLQTVLVGAVNLLFTVIAIWTVDKLGRKPLLVVGAAGMGVSLFAIGFAAYYQQLAVWTLIFMLGYIACFALSLGPVVWVVLSEIFPTKVRGRAMGIAALCLWTANLVVSQTFPMMAEDPWLLDRFHGGFPFWVYGTLCFVTVLFVLLFVPETKGKTLEEIERMWR
jgi:MFS transporter, SP family, xylose:H+ symportor